MLAIDRLWLRSRPRGACAALGFASCLSRQAGDCGFRSPSPCQARAQGLGELPRPFRIIQARDETAGTGGMASGLGGGGHRSFCVWSGVKPGITAAAPSLFLLSADYYPPPRPQSPSSITSSLVELGWRRRDAGYLKARASQQVRAGLVPCSCRLHSHDWWPWVHRRPRSSLVPSKCWHTPPTEL